MDIIRKGVYQIKCVINDRVYIGSSANIEKRLRQHFKALKEGKHHNYKLQADWDRYGEVMFQESILQECDFKLRTDIYNLEQVWLDSTKNKYNLLCDAKAHLKKDEQQLQSLLTTKIAGKRKKSKKAKVKQPHIPKTTEKRKKETVDKRTLLQKQKEERERLNAAKKNKPKYEPKENVFRTVSVAAMMKLGK